MADWLAESLTGREARLSLLNAVTLVRLREPMSQARAEAIVRTALKSGEISRDGLPGWYSKDDFLDWLNRHYPVAKPTPNPVTEPTPTKRNRRSRPRRDPAERAIQAIYGPDGIPPDEENGRILQKVGKRLKRPVSDKTILRAAGRAE